MACSSVGGAVPYISVTSTNATTSTGLTTNLGGTIAADAVASANTYDRLLRFLATR
ncbi:hypothetical protein [Pseudofrankia inefficax]|uniref:Uncharacterized protein n=1 Tax=Pseudofrankia inefficax (strain DSM 45817 / CECT 9037 / DDB 130130 / EuI1c) TaxID=298654 RepID=E3J6T3_PSEI1|nr:hypothetical protein [Pseudofrankia inefficax]ADP82007.1 hypothetical protein FraEuI1c_4003 [Pseudofrankia inefficax]